MRGQLAGDGKLADERVFLTEVDLTASDHEKVRNRLNITTLNKLRFPLALGLGRQYRRAFLSEGRRFV